MLTFSILAAHLQAPSAAEVLPKVVGEWVRVAPMSDPPERLTIARDGTATIRSEQFGQRSVVRARVEITFVTFGGQKNIPTLTFRPTSANGDASGALRIFFSEEEQVLWDPLTFLYMRPAAAKAELDRQRKAANAEKVIRPNFGNWKQVWSFPLVGPSGGIAVRANRIALPELRHVQILSTDGNPIARWTADVYGGAAAWGESAGVPYLALSNGWAKPLVAVSESGRPLWRVERGRGINQVSPIKLGPGNIGMAVAYNGGAGVEVFSPKGKRVMAVGNLGNVWGVAGARFRSGPVVLAGEDYLSIFSLSGKRLHQLGSGGHSSATLGVDLTGDGIDEVLGLGTTVASGLMLTAYDQSGRRLWSTRTSGGVFVDEPLFTIRAGGRLAIGVVSANGVEFFGKDGKRLGAISAEISAAQSTASGTLILRSYANKKSEWVRGYRLTGAW
jgi:hypothetical protein